MILFFYNIALMIALVASAPWWLWQIATTEKYRGGLPERVGLVRKLKGSGGRPVIWLQAVSVGEVQAVSRLVSMLDVTFPDHYVVVSTTTRTGQTLARERFGRNRVFYCPLDLPWAVRRYLNELKPAMVVLAETEFWPNLLHSCSRRKIPVVVVNGRISDRSWPRYWRLRGLWKFFLSRLTAVLAQSELDAERLRALGCVPERVTVVGNLKFDVRASRESEATKLIDKVRGDLRLVVAGSTLGGEEEMLLKAWPALVEANPKLGMLLAPRHPERFGEVAKLLGTSGFAWRRRTSLGRQRMISGEILLLDSMGELANLYALGTVAFVGGSLVAAGGHNPLEPAQFGVPVVMGEHYANFRAIVESMRFRDGLIVAAPEELAAKMGRLLSDAAFAKKTGEAGRQVFEELSGATERSIETIQKIMSQKMGVAS
jgi:3-deoxy-D-manno-octulosonic-acid transferase